MAGPLNTLLTARANAARQGVALTVTGTTAYIVARVFALTGTDRILGITT